MRLRHAYLALCLLGTALPYWKLLPWVMDHGLNVPLLCQELFATRIGAFFGLDVVVSRQIEPVMDVGFRAPARIVIGAAGRAGERAARDLLAADGTLLGSGEFRTGHFRVKPRNWRCKTPDSKRQASRAS